MGIVGPMGVYGAANDTDLTQHLVAELRKAMDAKSAAQRDANGNRYVPVDYFVVWQTVELLERRLLPVSYTHLDVYKRQPAVSPVRIQSPLPSRERWKHLSRTPR